jgi:hypothetical protein
MRQKWDQMRQYFVKWRGRGRGRARAMRDGSDGIEKTENQKTKKSNRSRKRNKERTKYFNKRKGRRDIMVQYRR